MKKYLLFIISMLCVSIGAWAEPTQFGSGGSTWEKNGTVLTLNINTTTDITSYYSAVTSLDGIEKVVVTTGPGVTLNCGAWDAPLTFINRYYYTVPLLDLSNASISTVASGTQQLLKMEDNNNAFKHILLPSTYESSLSSMLVTDAYKDSETYNTNLYTVSGTVVTAAYNNTSEHLVLTAINSSALTLKLANDIAGSINFTTVITSDMASAETYTIDLSNVTTGGDTSTNPITVADGTHVNCLSAGVNSRITGTAEGNIHFVNPVITCTANDLTTALTNLGSVPATSVTITEGTLTASHISLLNSQTSLKLLNLEGATVTDEILNTLTIASTLEGLALPKGKDLANPNLATLKGLIDASTSLYYYFIPTSSSARTLLDQTVADYVWVCKPGGLAKAFDDQQGLRDAIYMKVASTVALNEDDVNFYGPTDPGRVMQYLYLDLSASNITPAMAANYKVTDDIAYRIILPNDWTGDMMAVFAANPECGTLAAVYSYSGTTLNIMEINDGAYRQDALADARIVRPTTTAVKVVSGSYGGNLYSNFGENLRIALNNAGETSFHFVDSDHGINKDYTPVNNITSITIATGPHVTNTLTIANKKVTNLILAKLDNSSAVLDVTGCTALIELDITNSTLASVDAHGRNTLTTVNLDYTTTTGDINLSGTGLTTLSADHTNLGSTDSSGTLNVSSTPVVNLDLSKVTAKSINAENTNNLTDLNLNGIVLHDYMTAEGGTKDEITTSNRNSKIGTVFVERSSGNYTNFSPIVPEDENLFDKNRLVPNAEESNEAYEDCDNDHSTWETDFKTWFAARYLDKDGDDYKYIDMGSANSNYNSYKEGLFNSWLAENYQTYIDATQEEIETDYNTYTSSLDPGDSPMSKEDWLANNYSHYISESKMAEAVAAYDAQDSYKPTDFETWLGLKPYDEFNYETCMDDVKAKDGYVTIGGGESEPDCSDLGAYGYVTIPESREEVTFAGNTLNAKIIAKLVELDPDEALKEDYEQEEDAKLYANTFQILHVTGTLTADDVDYIRANMPSLEVLDLSGCTFDGIDHSKLITPGLSKDIAIILPGPNNEADMYAAMYAFQTNGYQCVGYYTNTDKTKLNVYAYNEVLGNLANATSPKLVSNDMDDDEVDENFTLTFLRKYATAAGGYYGYGTADYPSTTAGLKTALRHLQSYCIDMTWLDISELGRDFTFTNDAYTRYIIIPQNTIEATKTDDGVVFSNDFTDESADGSEPSDPKHYHFNDYIIAVSTYKSPVSPYATNAYVNGRVLQFDASNLNQTANITYIRNRDLESLNDVTAIMPDYLKSADRLMIAGRLNSNDINGLNELTSPQVDLSCVTNLVTTGDNHVDWSSYNNSNVKYLVLPDGKNDIINAKSPDECTFITTGESTGLNALKAVGAYDPTNTKYTVHSTANTVTWTDAPTNTTFSAQENSVYVITKLCAPNSTRSAGSALGLTKVEMSGYLTLDDIQANGGVAVQAGQAGLNCNNNCSITTADFTNAVFMRNEDMTFTGAYWSNALTSILLPTDMRQTLMPANCLKGLKGINALCIPYNYTHIDNAALHGTYCSHITTTDAAGSLIDNGPRTYTFSANLEEIGSKPTTKDANGVYSLSENVFPHDQGQTDVYVLAHKVPKCYAHAFPANMLYGWGGFKGADFPYCREKYNNSSDGSKIFTVLHFPDKASYADATEKTGPSYEDMEKLYTDINKVYTKKEQTGAVDANGDPVAWPTFAELRRAYNQATDGITWYDWTTEPDGNGEVVGGNVIPTAKDAITAGPHTNTYSFSDYEGWHQFVLSKATYVKPGEEQVEIAYREYVQDDSWYTFCIPFDMTEEDVIKLMGVPASTDKVKTTISTFGEHPETETDKYQQTELLPEIRTIKSVTRSPSTNTVNIYTSQDLGTGTYAKTFYKPAYGVTPENYDENGKVTIDGAAKDVMIRGGYPYLIKPWKLRGTTISSLGKDIMTRYQFRATQSSIYHTTADCYDSFGSGGTKTGTFARPYEGHKIQAVGDPGGALTHQDEAHKDQPYNYTYVGQFWKQSLPLHCFYQNSKRLWRHYQNYDARYFWNPYTCIIMVTDEVQSEEEKAQNKDLKGGKFRDEVKCQYPASSGLDKDGGEKFDKTLEVYYKNGLDDPFDKASARGYQFFFDDDIMDFDSDGQATAIEVLDGVRIAPVRGKVYNMAGQYVGNSLEGLSKGMYIVNGKKYVIK